MGRLTTGELLLQRWVDRGVPVLVAVVRCISSYRAQLLAVAAQHLRVEDILATAAVAERLHHTVYLLLKHF